MKLQRQRSDGSWCNETKQARIDRFIERAVEADKTMAPIRKQEPRTAQDILNALAMGEKIKYDLEYWYAVIRDANAQKHPQARQFDYPNGRKLGCGCTVYNKHEVMNASQGSSCAGCYDQMSDW